MKNKGVSLLILIITIIVIIILATSIIMNLSQNNIISSANEAVVKQDFKMLQEELEMYILDRYTETLGEFDESSLNATKSTSPTVYEILPSLKKSKYKDEVIVVDGKIIISEEIESKVKDWATEVVGDCVGYKQVEVGKIVTEENAVTTGVYPSYNNPVIPVGFMAVNTKEVTWNDKNNDGVVDGWNNGLVIADAVGNEFVWVPVDGTIVKYENNFSYPGWYQSFTESDTFTDTSALPILNGDTIDEYSQIAKYQGFYIGRYEAGVTENQTIIDGESEDTSNKEGIPVTKQGAKVWTCIDYTNANISAQSFVNTNSVKSGLVTGTQWDTTIKWIENSGVNVVDSRSWGNHKDSIAPANIEGYGLKQTAGYSEYWKVKNIYDLSGNTWEWTSEKNNLKRVRRGGNYSNYVSNGSASLRLGNNPSLNYEDISFRIVLYVM